MLIDVYVGTVIITLNKCQQLSKSGRNLLEMLLPQL